MFLTGNLLFDLFSSSSSGLWTAFPALSQAAGALLIAAIWQGAIVAACLALSLRFAARLATPFSAGLRFALWTAGFAAVVGLPFLPAAVHLFAPAATPLPTGLAAANANPSPWLQFDSRWSIALCLLWSAVSLYRAVDLAAHILHLRRLWSEAVPVETAASARRLFARKPVEICTTHALDRPSVLGFFAPRILIPAWLLPRLTPGELDQIVLHETEHLRRGDDWTNLLQKLSLILFPLNPVLLWMERQLCLEREMACDEAVIRVTHAPRAYAACLTNLAEQGLEHRSAQSAALSLGAWQRRPELVHRIHSLLLARPAFQTAFDSWSARGLAAALTCALAIGTIELARCPQLVAFVPARQPQTAQIQPPANLAIPPRAILAILRTPANPAALRPAGRLKAGPPRPVSTTFAAQPSSHPFAKMAAPRLQPELAMRAESSGGEQGWLVVTGWEEVAVATPGSEQEAIPGDGAFGGSPANGPVQGQPGGQITVTRMVFRVVPAGFVSPSPTALRLRNGWLVIQL